MLEIYGRFLRRLSLLLRIGSRISPVLGAGGYEWHREKEFLQGSQIFDDISDRIQRQARPECHLALIAVRQC